MHKKDFPAHCRQSTDLLQWALGMLSPAAAVHTLGLKDQREREVTVSGTGSLSTTLGLAMKRQLLLVALGLSPWWCISYSCWLWSCLCQWGRSPGRKWRPQTLRAFSAIFFPKSMFSFFFPPLRFANNSGPGRIAALSAMSERTVVVDMGWRFAELFMQYVVLSQ